MSQSLVNRTTEVSLKMRYSTCLENFNAVKVDMIDTIKAFKIGNFKDVQYGASGFLSYASTCLDEFDYPGPPLPMDPSLRQKVEEFVKICVMLVNVAHLMQ
ncbi:hypothetical protein M5689_023503 [Euphorbia peplus]|nr:hypothetical protein M5689_023503 [Euphorbia peplus]